MRSNFTILAIGTLLAASWSAPALSQPPCADGEVLTVDLVAAKGSVTILPSGTGETFAAAGTPITVCLECNGMPKVGLEARFLQVMAPTLRICPAAESNFADAATDMAGCTMFTGSLAGGGCSDFLEVWYVDVAGVPTTLLGTVPIEIKSPNVAVGGRSAFTVDASDLAAFASALGRPAVDFSCYDYNDSEGFIGGDDLAFFASVFGRNTCPGL